MVTCPRHSRARLHLNWLPLLGLLAIGQPACHAATSGSGPLATIADSVMSDATRVACEPMSIPPYTVSNEATRGCHGTRADTEVAVVIQRDTQIQLVSRRWSIASDAAVLPVVQHLTEAVGAMTQADHCPSVTERARIWRRRPFSVMLSTDSLSHSAHLLFQLGAVDYCSHAG
jgi:hypothetical protein